LSVTNGGTLGAASGAVTVNGGTLDLGAQISTNGNFTISSGTVQNGTLSDTNYNLSGGTVNATLADGTGGASALTKTGAGTATLAGINTFTGPTAVNGGQLLVATNASIASLVTTVASGGTLLNNGSVAGTTTISAGGTFAGNGGTNVNLTFNTASFLNWNLNGTSTDGTTTGLAWDLTTITGNLGFSSFGSTTNDLTINIAGSITLPSSSASYTFNLFNVNGAVDPLSTTNVYLNTSLFTDNLAGVGIWSVQTNAAVVNGASITQVQAVLTEAVPEPSTYLLFGLGGLALVVAYRRRVN
jgi:autotransporter-associated beta strand protein